MSSASAILPTFFAPEALPGYALLDSGGGEKLERFGEVLLARPDPQALWHRRLDAAAWQRADLAFERESDRGGRWRAGPHSHASARKKDPEWTFELAGARFLLRPTPFKHVGLFPEQQVNWSHARALAPELGSEPALLNLFAYTGVASVLAARAGYRVTHVDASRSSIAWARANAEASGLDGERIRWVLDDALGFARREARRGVRYEGVLLDPPHYGRGPKGERWQLEEGLAPLLEACRRLLAPRAFLVLSTYAVGYSPLAFTNLLAELEPGHVEAGELVLPEATPDGRAPRHLPCGFCARYRRGFAD